MSIKSWFVSLMKKMEEKSDRKLLRDLKAIGAREIRLDEDMKLYVVMDKGTIIRESKSLSSKLKDPVEKDYFYDQTVQANDELFGSHRECVENSKVILVWDVK